MAAVRRVEWMVASKGNSAAPAATRMSLAWLVRTGLSFCFLIAFLQYEISISATQYLPLAVLGVCALLVLSGRHRNERLQHILSGGGLWFAAMLFSEVVSYTSHDTYSTAYGIVFVGVFLSARL